MTTWVSASASAAPGSSAVSSAAARNRQSLFYVESFMVNTPFNTVVQ
ncbi:MAG: hypothetical protein IJH86_04370 [Clostridia bacterium]|nr:hypothetical protein [Clostridia bacterium]